MKLSGRDAARYVTRPDPDAAGALIYGADAMRVALRRQDIVAALIGPEGEAEMRLSRMSGADLRKDAAMLLDAVKAQGFFPGARAVLVEEAGDGTAPVVAAALADWRPGDAQIIVTAGQLAARSALRKLFETHPSAPAIGVYNDPPSRDEIVAELNAAGLTAVSRDAMEALSALGRELDPGDFRQTVEKLALYRLGAEGEVSPEDVLANAPQTIEAGQDDMIHAVAEGQTGAIGPLMQRLTGQGATAVGLCISATRHFRALHVAASDPGGPGAGIARLRPPVFGPRRDRMQRQASGWGMHRLEQALHVLVETDLQLRSAGQTAPALALVERAFIRLSMLARR